MRPVDAGFITYDKLLITGDGAIDASEIYMFNQYIDIKNESEQRHIDAQKRG